MKKIIHYHKFMIKEADDADLEDPEKSDELSLDRFTELKDELLNMIQTSLGSEDKKLTDDFINAYERSPEDNVIEGLINDSDVYDFYLMWRTNIDDILSAVNFFDEMPSEMKVYSLYDYIINGTKRAVREMISLMQKR
jgi:hypothetical protein